MKPEASRKEVWLEKDSVTGFLQGVHATFQLCFYEQQHLLSQTRPDYKSQLLLTSPKTEQLKPEFNLTPILKVTYGCCDFKNRL